MGQGVVVKALLRMRNPTYVALLMPPDNIKFVLSCIMTVKAAILLPLPCE